VIGSGRRRGALPRLRGRGEQGKSRRLPYPGQGLYVAMSQLFKPGEQRKTLGPPPATLLTTASQARQRSTASPSFLQKFAVEGAQV